MKDLTQGSVTRQLLGLSGFLLIGMAMLTLYTLVDLYFVGSLGADAVAAVAVSSNLMMISMALSQMLGVGTGALVAQAVGAREHETAHRLFNQAMGIALAGMLIFAAVAWLAQGAYIEAFSADARSAQLTGDYLKWFIPSMALQFPLMVMSAALRGTGNMMPGTLAQSGSVLLNIVLAPILIFGWLGAPRLGVAGAGLATFLSAVAGVLALWLYFRRPQTYLKLRLQQWAPQFKTWWRIVKIGLPSAAEFALMGCYLIFITAVLRPYGATEQAAFGIGQRILQAAMMPIMAVSYAASAIAGQNYGARLGGRVREALAATLKISVCSMTLVCLVMQLMPTGLIHIFSNDQAVLAAGTDFLRVLSFNLLAVSVAFSCFGILSGLGNTIPSLISSATRIGLVVLPALVLLKQPTFKVVWLWYLSVAATVVQMSMNLWFVRRELARKLDPIPWRAEVPIEAVATVPETVAPAEISA